MTSVRRIHCEQDLCDVYADFAMPRTYAECTIELNIAGWAYLVKTLPTGQVKTLYSCPDCVKEARRG